MAKSIKFSELEIEMLIQNYQMELGEALNYVEQIKAILEKLGSQSEDKTEKPKEKKTGAKRGRKPKVAVLPVAEEPVAAEPVKREKKAPKVKKEKIVKEPKVRKEKKQDAPASVESVVGSLIEAAPKKVVKKASPKAKKEKVKKVSEVAKPAKKAVAVKKAKKEVVAADVSSIAPEQVF